jgi:hypothetical protein
MPMLSCESCAAYPVCRIVEQGENFAINAADAIEKKPSTGKENTMVKELKEMLGDRCDYYTAK